MTHLKFFKEVEKLFPNSIEYLNKWDIDNDLPYIRMSSFASFTYDYFEKGEKEMYFVIIKFVESKISIADIELTNMLCVSFVEDLVFDLAKSNKAKIIETLPIQMHSMYEGLRPLFEK